MLRRIIELSYNWTTASVNGELVTKAPARAVGTKASCVGSLKRPMPVRSLMIRTLTD